MTREAGERIRHVFGVPMTAGTSPRAAVEDFIGEFAPIFGGAGIDLRETWDISPQGRGLSARLFIWRTLVGVAAMCASAGPSTVFGQDAWMTLDGPRLVTTGSAPTWFDVHVGFDFVPMLAEGFGGLTELSVESDEPLMRQFYVPGTLRDGGRPTWKPTSIYMPSIFNPHFPQLGIFGSQDNPIRVFVFAWTPQHLNPRWVTIRAACSSVTLISNWSIGNPVHRVDNPRSAEFRIRVRPEQCFADCDTTTGLEVLDIFDFLCFGNHFVVSDPFACDCETSTGPGVCDIFDFLCFQNAFAAGCD